MLRTVADVLARRIAGQTLTASELEAALTKRDRLPQPDTGAVAVIPVHGVIVPRGNLFSDVSGATSLDALRSQLQAALNAKAVDTILLDVDSPGGSAAGATEFARDVMKARTKKPVVAVAQYTMASAAYWISAAATEIVASPSAQVGSIGVYTIHDDLSKALAELGIKRTYIAAGKFKVDGNETEPLSASAREHIQGLVDATYDRFVADISRGRGVAKDDVKTKFGQGRMMTADDALSRRPDRYRGDARRDPGAADVRVTEITRRARDDGPSSTRRTTRPRSPPRGPRTRIDPRHAGGHGLNSNC